MITISESHANDGGAATSSLALFINSSDHFRIDFRRDTNSFCRSLSFHVVACYTPLPLGSQAQNGTVWNIFDIAGNTVERLAFPVMGGKNKFFRVRSDDQLKAALKAAAERSDRQESDQARYLLRIALGLLDEEADEIRTVKKRMKRLRSIKAPAEQKGG